MSDTENIDKENIDEENNNETADDSFEEFVFRERKASEFAKMELAKAMISNSHATDLTQRQVISLMVLTAIQRKIKSIFLGDLIETFIVLRKSVNRKDRKEFKEMFQSLSETDDEGNVDKLKGLFGDIEL